MKDRLNIVITRGADGWETQNVGLSVGEARSFFDRICRQPKKQWIEVAIFEKLRANKSRRLIAETAPPVRAIPAPPRRAIVDDWDVKPKARIVRRGR